MNEKRLMQWREEFPILRRWTYLISNSLGAMPRGARAHLQEYGDLWSSAGVEAWSQRWWSMPSEVGNLIASLMGAGSDEVSILPNVTIGHWVASSSLRRRSGRNKIVYTELNFPSSRYFYESRPEWRVEVVPSEDGISIATERLLEAIDSETLLVPISHVLFRSSYVQDVSAVIEKAHAVGARVLLDSYHSCGVLPFDVGSLQPDFVVGGVLKWLCGGPGVAFLWVNPERGSTLRPQLTGWLAHRDPFDFSVPMEWTEGAYRFMNGTPNIPGLYAALSGLEIISEVGIDTIRRRSLQLTDRLLESADEAGIPVRSWRERASRGGHVTLAPQHSDRVAERLIQEGFLVDHRPGSGIRVAPHFYNSEDEVESVVTAISEIAREEEP